MILDSNILIYFVEPNYDTLRAYLAEQKEPLYISLITKLEVLGFHKLKPVHKSELEQLLDIVSLLPITNNIINEAIRLRQQRKRSLGDSIIAATALLYNQPILTHNTSDFDGISGLEVISMASVL
ncbi:type II toxin-antitoxin system VapC family toxin [Spirosoma validum]|uniref:Type II toxin-antitoxin system VapC family toxin n=1 Tax=Spirosoma validum TaxID=2771355 RepID=A0A927B4P0_9BACT|nr:type II toxin-antitoxin system VapC family toxin [Spirosoma validum]MBD2755238.1 type II toxin-antitoxin system VapC family toxin [Spirosoma validum]